MFLRERLNVVVYFISKYPFGIEKIQVLFPFSQPFFGFFHVIKNPAPRGSAYE